MSRRRAFTLVELLVVIGIIALLISILLPSLSRAKESAKQVKCLNNLRQIGIANQGYLTEYKDFNLPGYWGWSAAGAGWPPSNPPAVPADGPRGYWFQVFYLTKFMGSVNIDNGRYPSSVLCPNAPLSWSRGDEVNGFTLHNSYGMNYTNFPGMSTTLAPIYLNAWKRNQVLAPSDKIFFCDATNEGVSIGGNPNGTMKYFDPYYGEKHEAPDKANIVAYRHSKGANVLFYDGHALWMRMDNLLYDPAKPETADNKRQWDPKAP